MHSFGQTATHGVNKPNIARMFKRSNNPLSNCWMPKLKRSCCWLLHLFYYWWPLMFFPSFQSEPPTWLLCGRRRRRLQFSFVIRDTFAKSSIAQNATDSLMLTIDLATHTHTALCCAPHANCVYRIVFGRCRKQHDSAQISRSHRKGHRTTTRILFPHLFRQRETHSHTLCAMRRNGKRNETSNRLFYLCF